MNIMPMLDGQLIIIDIEMIRLLVDDTEIVIKHISDEWDVDYCKSLDSSISFSFSGMSNKLLEVQRHRKHISYVKLIGRCIDIDRLYSCNDADKKNIIWNIPCDLYIDELNSYTDDNRASVTEVTLRGDIW